MIILDTSFLFAYFQETDVNHGEALKLAKELDSKSYIIPSEVLKELITVVTYKVSSKSAVELVELLISETYSATIIYTDKEIFMEVINKFKKRATHKFSYVDILILTLSEKLDAEIFTFDKDLEKEYFKERYL